MRPLQPVTSVRNGFGSMLRPPHVLLKLRELCFKNHAHDTIRHATTPNWLIRAAARAYDQRMLIVLIGLLLLGLAAFGIFGFVVLGATGRAQKKAEENASEILDKAFDGRPDVTFSINMASLKYETVIVGAKRRGYKLTHQAENQYGPHTLIFEKA